MQREAKRQTCGTVQEKKCNVAAVKTKAYIAETQGSKVLGRSILVISTFLSKFMISGTSVHPPSI